MEFEKLKEIIADVLSIDADEITMDTTFVEDLGADSLDTVELLLEFEKVFGIKIPDEESGSIATVKDAVDKVAEKLAQN